MTGFTLREFYKGNIKMDGHQWGWFKFICSLANKDASQPFT